MPLILGIKPLILSPSTITSKCWHCPQWEQYGGLKSQGFSWLINPELHFHAPRDQVTPALGGSRTYVSLSFICLLTAECFTVSSSSFKTNYLNWKILPQNPMPVVVGFMHNFLSVLDYTRGGLWIFMIGIYNLMLCLFCWLIQGHFVS